MRDSDADVAGEQHIREQVEDGRWGLCLHVIPYPIGFDYFLRYEFLNSYYEFMNS